MDFFNINLRIRITIKVIIETIEAVLDYERGGAKVVSNNYILMKRKSRKAWFGFLLCNIIIIWELNVRQSLIIILLLQV